MTSRTAATRYARALFDVAGHEQHSLEAIETQLAAFVDLFKQHSSFEKVLLNPAVPVARKRAVVDEITTNHGVNPVLSKLLALLAERDRLILLPDLLAAYRQRLLDHQHVIRAEVTTAWALSLESTRQIEQRLASVTGKTVMVSSRVDPSILGGLVARIGGTVYDASVTHQLEKIRMRLVEGV